MRVLEERNHGQGRIIDGLTEARAHFSAVALTANHDLARLVAALGTYAPAFKWVESDIKYVAIQLPTGWITFDYDDNTAPLFSHIKRRKGDSVRVDIGVSRKRLSKFTKDYE